MWISKVSELIGSSNQSFEDATRNVLQRANRSLRGITGIEILDKSLKVTDDGIDEYRVRLRLRFDMVQEQEQHW